MNKQLDGKIERALREVFSSFHIKTGKAQSKDGFANSGIVFGDINSGIDADVFCAEMKSAVASLAEKIARSGERVTEDVVKSITQIVVSDGLHYLLSEIKQSQRASESALEAAIQSKFRSFQSDLDGFVAKISREIAQQPKGVGGIENALNALSRESKERADYAVRKIDAVLDGIHELEGLIEGQSARAAERANEIQKMLRDVLARLDEQKKEDMEPDDVLIRRLPENEDFKLGWVNYCGGKYSEALQYFFRAAKTNHFRAQYLIGCCYYNGEGVDVNYAEAAKWFAMSAKSGYSQAQVAIGDCLFFGNGVPTDYDSAFRYYIAAAKKQNAEAMASLGTCYENGYGVAPNILTAVEWYNRAAELGNPNGQLFLGCCYYFEKGVVKDYRKAADLFFRAANGGNEVAQANYAECLEKGIGVPQVDIDGAIKYYELAAKQGDKDAETAATRLRLLRNKV